MKVISIDELPAERKVEFHAGVSNRLLLAEDGAGYTMTKTVISPTAGKVFQHYKNHHETCYCVSGRATLTNSETGEEFEIKPDVTYILDKNDPHYFEAHEETVLICTFNPPLTGKETHQEDGSYSVDDGYLSPVYDVKRVHMDMVTANDYNPNSIAPPEMALLETSIWEDGYTQPIVTVFDPENNRYVVIDGFHRYLTLSSTIRHNRARGTHNIELMSTIVSELVEMGKGDRWICQHIGMSSDELLRLKQITGVAALFQNKSFSDSWDVEQLDKVYADEES